MEDVSLHLRDKTYPPETTTHFEPLETTKQEESEKESSAETIYGPLPESSYDNKEENRDQYVLVLKVVLSLCSASFAFLLIRYNNRNKN